MIVSPLVERIKNCDNIYKFVLIKCLSFSRYFVFAIWIGEICRSQLLNNRLFYLGSLFLAAERSNTFVFIFWRGRSELHKKIFFFFIRRRWTIAVALPWLLTLLFFILEPNNRHRALIVELKPCFVWHFSKYVKNTDSNFLNLVPDQNRCLPSKSLQP